MSRCYVIYSSAFVVYVLVSWENKLSVAVFFRVDWGDSLTCLNVLFIDFFGCSLAFGIEALPSASEQEEDETWRCDSRAGCDWRQRKSHDFVPIRLSALFSRDPLYRDMPLTLFNRTWDSWECWDAIAFQSTRKWFVYKYSDFLFSERS